MSNLDQDTIHGFGFEWQRFDQRELSQKDRQALFDAYFHLVRWDLMPIDAACIDVGCGSGRWAEIVAGKVKRLHVLDASAAALDVARRNLKRFENIKFHCASVDRLPIPDNSLDFAYSLGVLHHVPKTQEAINSIASKLKVGAPFLIYLYYSFDNRPKWFSLMWKATEWIRFALSRARPEVRYFFSQLIAAFVYWPFARMALIWDKAGCLPSSWPLSAYRDRAFYVMRTDALDRFGTRLEQRFSREEIRMMLIEAGFENVRFSETAPFWVALGTKSDG